MRNYELTLILSPEENPDVDNIRELITQKGGSVDRMEEWGKKRLSYPIKHFSQANYIYAEIKMEPDLLDSFHEDLRTRSDILRYLVVKKE
jgi:small subunit ribosomal protein S6